MTLDRDEAERGRIPLRPPRYEATGAGEVEQLRQTADFRLSDGAAERRDPVIPAPLVVLLRSGPFASFQDQALLHHPWNGAIQGPRAEFEFATGPGGHILNDGVAVAIGVGDR